MLHSLCISINISVLGAVFKERLFCPPSVNSCKMWRRVGLKSTDVGIIEWPLPRLGLHRSMKSAATARKCCVSNSRAWLRPLSPQCGCPCRAQRRTAIRPLCRISAPGANVVEGLTAAVRRDKHQRQLCAPCEQRQAIRSRIKECSIIGREFQCLVSPVRKEYTHTRHSKHVYLCPIRLEESLIGQIGFMRQSNRTEGTNHGRIDRVRKSQQ